MTEINSCPPGSSTVISELTAPGSIALTLPRKTLRALIYILNSLRKVGEMKRFQPDTLN